MGDVTPFPGGPKLPRPRDVWDARTREYDEGYVLAILKALLPAEAQRYVAGLDLASIARAVLLEIDTARHERRFNPDYDEHRAGGELGTLERMFTPPSPPKPTPEGTA